MTIQREADWWDTLADVAIEDTQTEPATMIDLATAAMLVRDALKLAARGASTKMAAMPPGGLAGGPVPVRLLADTGALHELVMIRVGGEPCQCGELGWTVYVEAEPMPADGHPRRATCPVCDKAWIQRGDGQWCADGSETWKEMHGQ